MTKPKRNYNRHYNIQHKSGVFDASVAGLDGYNLEAEIRAEEKRAEKARRLAPRLYPSGKRVDEIIVANVRIDPWSGRPVHHDGYGGFVYFDTGQRAPWRVGYACGFRHIDIERENVSKQMEMAQ